MSVRRAVPARRRSVPVVALSARELSGSVGIVAAAALVPAGLLVYWLFNNLWTFVQQGLVWRFAPTPGSPAAARRLVSP
jgi:hypothetical protein